MVFVTVEDEEGHRTYFWWERADAAVCHALGWPEVACWGGSCVCHSVGYGRVEVR